MSQPEPKLGSEPGFRFVWACLTGLPGVSQHERWRKLIENNILRQWVWRNTSQVSESPGKLKNMYTPHKCITHSGRVCMCGCVGVSVYPHTRLGEHCFGPKPGPEMNADQLAPGAPRTPENTGQLLYLRVPRALNTHGFQHFSDRLHPTFLNWRPWLPRNPRIG